MPTRTLVRCFTSIHKFWYRATGGLIGGRFGRIPVLLLTTTGRRSGRPWTTPLSYLADNGDVVVIASNGGSDRHPAWYVNLRANPQAIVQVGSRQFAATAETADATDKARLWPQIVQMYPGYDDYQRRTSRDIPVVILRAHQVD